MASSDKVLEARKRAEAQVRAQKRMAILIWSVVGLIVAGLIGTLIAFIVFQDKTDGGDGPAPTQAAEDGAFGVGASGVVGEGLGVAPARLDLYFDFMCPYCNLFEQSQAEMLAELRAEGVVEVYYHPISFLDRASQGTEYSTRAASAAALIAEESPESFLAFLDGMMDNQPTEGTEGLTDEQIQEIARAAGVPDAVVAKIPDHAYADWVAMVTEDASSSGVSFTPAIKINGELQDPTKDADAVNWGADGALEAALREAAKQ